MGRTREELTDTMTAAEFREWQARETIDPLPDPWLETGTIAAAVVSPWTRRRIAPADFVPVRKVRPQRQTAAQIRAAIHSCASVKTEGG
jgi:hypothetical protein